MITIKFNSTPFRSLLLAVTLTVALQGVALAQTAVTKVGTIADRDTEMIQRLSKEKNEDTSYSYLPNNNTLALNFKDPSFNAINLAGKTYAVTVPARSAFSLVPSKGVIGVATILYNSPDVMPTKKPNMSEFNMPVKKLPKTTSN